MTTEHIQGNRRDANGRPHSWNVHNGRKFGKRYGRKGGKARWASMTQEEKDLYWAKTYYYREQTRRMKAKMSKTGFKPAKTELSAQDVEDYEEFFGDIL